MSATPTTLDALTTARAILDAHPLDNQDDADKAGQEANAVLAGLSTEEIQKFFDEYMRERSMSKFEKIARAAIARGENRVLPIEVGGKNPAISWVNVEPPGNDIDTMTQEQWSGRVESWVQELANQFPNLNCCVVAKPDEFCFVDCDSYRELVAGYEAFAGEPFPVTYTTSARENRTQIHFYQTDATRVLGNIPQFAVDGVDLSFRQRNEYVVAEGSQHKNRVDVYKRVVDSAIAPMPDKLVEYIRHLKSLVKVESATSETPRATTEKVPHGQIHPWMLAQAGKLRQMGLNQENIEDTLRQLVEDNCEPPIDWDKVDAMAKSVCNYEPGDPRFGPLVLNQSTAQPVVAPASTELFAFKYSAVLGSHRDYIVAPMLGQKDGWFPLGDPSLIGGSSGAGKTTWMLEQLEKQSRQENVYGHKTFGLSYLVIMHDRGDAAFERTMERMSLGKIPVKRLPPTTGYAALQAIINKIEEDGQDKIPQIVFVEGADMLVEDASKGHFVVPFMSGIQHIAEHYHIAFIMSVGAPKMRVGEGYVAKRDSILGSEKWSRMSETVVALQYPEGDDTDDKRTCFVMLRNGPPEKFDLVFRGGELVINDKPGMELKPAPAPAKKDFVEDAKTWYWKLFTGADGKLKTEVTLMEHRKAEQKVVGILPENTLRRARVALGITYDHHKKAYCFLEPPPDNTVSLQRAEGEPGVEPEALEVGSKFDPENAF